MARVDAIDPSVLGRVFVAEETSFATGGTDKDLCPLPETLDHTGKVQTVPVQALRVRPNDVRPHAQGNRSGELAFEHMLQPRTAVIDATGTITDTGQVVVLRCLMGGHSVAVGSDVVAAPAPTAAGASVTAASGAGFPVGQLVQIVDPADGLVPAVITSRATDALTWWPSLSGAPATGADVRNSDTFYVSQTNSKSLRVRIASAQEATHQFEYVGCTGSLEFNFDKDGIAKFSVKLEAANFTGPTAQSLSQTSIADPNAEGLICRNAKLYLQAPATTTRTAYDIEAFSLKVSTGMAHVETYVGGTQGKRAVARLEGLNEAVAEIELEGRADDGIPADFLARTEKSLMFHIDATQDTGVRGITVYCGKVRWAEQPSYFRGGDGLMRFKGKLMAELNDNYTGSPDVVGLAQTGVAIALH